MNRDDILISVEKYLTRITETVGDKITEYHWREACGILLEIENLKSQKLNKNTLGVCDFDFDDDVSEIKCSTCSHLFSIDPKRPCHDCVGFSEHESRE